MVWLRMMNGIFNPILITVLIDSKFTNLGQLFFVIGGEIKPNEYLLVLYL